MLGFVVELVVVPRFLCVVVALALRRQVACQVRCTGFVGVQHAGNEVVALDEVRGQRATECAVGIDGDAVRESADVALDSRRGTSGRLEVDVELGCRCRFA